MGRTQEIDVSQILDLCENHGLHVILSGESLRVFGSQDGLAVMRQMIADAKPRIVAALKARLSSNRQIEPFTDLELDNYFWLKEQAGILQVTNRDHHAGYVRVRPTPPPPHLRSRPPPRPRWWPIRETVDRLMSVIEFGDQESVRKGLAELEEFRAACASQWMSADYEWPIAEA